VTARPVRVTAFLAAAAGSAWWWRDAIRRHTVAATWALTLATLHGYHAALLAGPAALLAFTAWLLFPLARPRRHP
jgi:hypothetical protein